MPIPFLRNKDKAPAAAPRAAVGGDEAQVLAARTQARQRLVGALVLLVAGVIGFPILFETQPRPLPVDMPILVPQGTPARVTAAPAPSSAAVARPLPTLPPDAGTESAVVPGKPGAATPSPAASAAVAVAAAQPASAAAPKATAAAAPGSAPSAAPKTALATTPAPVVTKPALPAAAASAAVKPSAESPAASGGRYVVQVGAYNDLERMKAARAKLEKLGFKTFTQDVDSPTGKRTRVRVGPYGNKQEAEAVAAKVKAAGMQAAILSL